MPWVKGDKPPIRHSRAARPPSLEAQRQVFLKQSEGRHWLPVTISLAPMSVWDELRWIIRNHPEAQAIDRRPGRQANWQLMLDGITFLDRGGVNHLSAAPRSKCVQRLKRFYQERLPEAERDGTYVDDAAIDLARRLIALRETISAE